MIDLLKKESKTCPSDVDPNDMQDVNRFKIVLVEQKKTSKWLSDALGVNPSTVSKWCTNSSQPDIETLAKISKLLDFGIEELYNQQFMQSVSF